MGKREPPDTKGDGYKAYDHSQTNRTLLTEVPRAPFIPDHIWIHDGNGLVPLDKADDPDRWAAAVEANIFLVTQVNLGTARPDATNLWPSSSCSMPSIVADMLAALDVRRDDSVLEIGTGTGWNAALLSGRAGPTGQVVTIEIDAAIADAARTRLGAVDHHPLVITGDGAAGYADAAPYDKVIFTAAVRETVPRAWLDQLRPGGRLVTPWETDWWGTMLTLDMAENGRAIGRFTGNLEFMRLRGHRWEVSGWVPDDTEINTLEAAPTGCWGVDGDRIFNPDHGRFAIGLRVPNCYLHIEFNQLGERHHIVDLDDGSTRSFARLDWHINGQNRYTVRQLGPRRLWDEVEAAYDWWYEQGEPGLDRFGFEVANGREWVWLDEPSNVVRYTHRPPVGS